MFRVADDKDDGTNICQRNTHNFMYILQRRTENARWAMLNTVHYPEALGLRKGKPKISGHLEGKYGH